MIVLLHELICCFFFSDFNISLVQQGKQTDPIPVAPSLFQPFQAMRQGAWPSWLWFLPVVGGRHGEMDAKTRNSAVLRARAKHKQSRGMSQQQHPVLFAAWMGQTAVSVANAASGRFTAQREPERLLTPLGALVGCLPTASLKNRARDMEGEAN